MTLSRPTRNLLALGAVAGLLSTTQALIAHAQVGGSSERMPGGVERSPSEPDSYGTRGLAPKKKAAPPQQLEKSAPKPPAATAPAAPAPSSRGLGSTGGGSSDRLPGGVERSPNGAMQ